MAYVLQPRPKVSTWLKSATIQLGESGSNGSYQLSPIRVLMRVPQRRRELFWGGGIVLVGKGSVEVQLTAKRNLPLRTAYTCTVRTRLDLITTLKISYDDTCKDILLFKEHLPSNEGKDRVV